MLRLMLLGDPAPGVPKGPQPWHPGAGLAVALAGWQQGHWQNPYRLRAVRQNC